MLVAGLVSLLVSMVYEMGLLRWKQATPGKLLLKLQVRMRDRPGAMRWLTIFLRWLVNNSGALASQVPIAGSLLAVAWRVNFLWPLWDDKDQAIHDQVAATNVVNLG